MDEELLTKIGNLIQAVQTIASKVDELSDRVDQLDSVIFDGLIGPANEQIAQQEYDDALSDFRCKFGEKLEKFDSLAKAEEGDDFDLIKKAFDDYNEHDYPLSPSEYIDKRVEQFEEKAKALAEAANAVVTLQTETKEGEEVQVTATPDGEVETEVVNEEPKEEEKENTDEDDARSKWRKAAQSDEFKNLKI